MTSKPVVSEENNYDHLIRTEGTSKKTSHGIYVDLSLTRTTDPNISAAGQSPSHQIDVPY